MLKLWTTSHSWKLPECHLVSRGNAPLPHSLIQSFYYVHHLTPGGTVHIDYDVSGTLWSYTTWYPWPSSVVSGKTLDRGKRASGKATGWRMRMEREEVSNQNPTVKRKGWPLFELEKVTEEEVRWARCRWDIMQEEGTLEENSLLSIQFELWNYYSKTKFFHWTYLGKILLR